MKILFIYRFLIIGGVCTHLANRARPLAAMGHQADFLFCKDHGGAVLFPSQSNLYLAEGAPAIATFLLLGEWDLITIIDTPEAVEALRLAEITTPWVLEVLTTTTNIAYLEAPENLLGAAAIITPSAYMKSHLASEYQLDRLAPIYEVPNELEIEQFVPGEAAEHHAQPIILWVGKFDDHKRWKDCLEVARMACAAGFPAQFLMVGGYTCREAVSAEFFSLLNNYNLFHTVRWLAWMDYKRMPEFYRLAAASGGAHFIASRNESFSMTSLESACCGCPVVAPAVGALTQLVGGMRSGTLYEFGRLDQALAALQAVYADRQRIHALALEDAERLRCQYSAEKVTAQLIELLKPIVEKRA